jgi:hypothetical protein
MSKSNSAYLFQHTEKPLRPFIESYLSTVGDHQKVMLFNTPEEAEAFLWQSDCLVRIATRVAPIQIRGQM